MSIFDPKEVPKPDSLDLPTYGEEAIATLMAHYGAGKPAETLDGISTNREAIITPDISTEWKSYRQLLVNKPESEMKAQLMQLVSHGMIKTLFPSLSKIGAICLSIPVTTASVERSFSHMKLIKNKKLFK